MAENAATTPPALAYFVHFPRLYIALSGHDRMWIEQAGVSRLIHLHRGEAVMVPANCWNRPVASRSCVALNMLFGRKQIGLSLVTSDDDDTAPSVLKTVLPGAQETASRAIMQALQLQRAGRTKVTLLLVEALLRSMAEALAASPLPPRRRAADLYESICMHVQEHFQSALNRDSVAAHFRISPNHVSRLFQHEGMVSFNDYVTYVRINWAKHLLRNHRQTIDEVATMCGFSETSYFCRVFKQKTEFTPSIYRQLDQA